MKVNLKPLLKRLNRPLSQGLEGAAGICVSRSQYEVTIEHLLLKMAEDPRGDIQEILRHYEVEPATFIAALQRTIERFRTGNPSKPVFSPLLIEMIKSAWLIASVELELAEIRSGVLFLALLHDSSRSYLTDHTDVFERINAEDLQKNFFSVVTGSSEDAASRKLGEGTATTPGGGARPKAQGGREADSALAKYTTDFTAEARAGRLDPVFERDKEIRQIIDILARRRKNNPIIVGEAGTGKTALVEGLALRIIAGDVPQNLRGVDLLGLDIGALQAGAGMKGEFENRLKGVLTEIKASAKPIVIFIDEAHMLIGAGGSAGGSDAANLLKPALARGELRSIAATTWSEYKKYFEKDPALTRRFQVVKCDEPSEDGAIAMLRGLRNGYEKSHGVKIREDAVVAAARLANRYISGRMLPDKAVDLLDTAAARVNVSLSSKPDELDDVERRIITIEREIESLQRDADAGRPNVDDRSGELKQTIETLRLRVEELTGKWMQEKELAEQIIQMRDRLLQSAPAATAENEAAPPASAAPAPGSSPAKGAAPAAVENGNAAAAPQAPLTPEERANLKTEIGAKMKQLEEMQGHRPLLYTDVNPMVVAKVVADWTGIPVMNMVRDEVASILKLGDTLKERIKGQDQAIDALSKGVRASKAGLSNPDAPMGVFLLVGPSGVGKTETALSVADLLFGGERFMTSINMSEFQESHSVSRLVGSPPGYVGYGEGGVLTEAVRQRPYSVVLLDECEKAHLDVMNLFYQVFDKGVLSDGEGRIIDFKNTIVFLTSNLATNEIMQLTEDDEELSAEELATQIRPALSRHFKPALLARMTIVPYFPLRGAALARIVELKLKRLGKRLAGSHRMSFAYTPAVVEQIAARCTEVETGARNIDHIINGSLLPRISTAILEQIGEGELPDHLHLALDDEGEFKLDFSSDGAIPEATPVAAEEQAEVAVAPLFAGQAESPSPGDDPS